MGFHGLLERIDRLQRRCEPLAFAVGVVKKFGEDRGSRLAALISYYAFFSFFPLLMVFVTVLGFVLEGRPELREDIVDSALSQIPSLGDDLVSTGIEGNWWAFAVGITAATWAGLGAMLAGQEAMNAVWDVPAHERPNFLWKRIRGLLLLGVIGTGLVGTTVLQNIAAVLDGIPGAGRVAIVAGGVALNVVVMGLSFRVLTDERLSLRTILPGALLAGVAYSVIQWFGSWYFRRVVAGANDTYGTFATVIGLLSWFYLLAQVIVFSAEVNVVKERRLWPRSLTGRDPTTQDHAAHAAQRREVSKLPRP